MSAREEKWDGTIEHASQMGKAREKKELDLEARISRLEAIAFPMVREEKAEPGGGRECARRARSVRQWAEKIGEPSK